MTGGPSVVAPVSTALRRAGTRLRLLATLLIILAARQALAQPVIMFPGGDAVAVLGGDVLTADDEAVRRFDPTTGALLQEYPPPPGASAFFGRSLAVVGGNLLVGDVGFSSLADGSAYLLDGVTGALLQALDTGLPADGFGFSVAALGSHLLVGAPGDDTGALNAGAVHLFDGTTGALIRTFHSPTPAPWAFFGWAVAAVGSNVLVGAPQLNSSGKAFLFDAMTGVALETLTAPTPAFNDSFGGAVAAFGDDVLVGAPRNNVDAGAAYLFDGATGALIRTLSTPATPHVSAYGSAFAVSGSTILIGAAGPRGFSGAFFIDGTTGATLRSIGIARGADLNFGISVAIVNGNAVVASPGVFTDSPAESYLFCGGTAGCGTCETCGSLGGCVAAPAPTCRPPAAVDPRRRPHLRVGNLSGDTSDSISWAGLSSIPVGRNNAAGDFAEPESRQDYALCLYDESGPTPNLIFRAVAPAGGDCPTRPCWRKLRYQGASSGEFRGFRFVDRERAPDGIRSLHLKTILDRLNIEGIGFLRESQISLKASGPALSNRPLGIPALPLPLPLRAQFQAEGGQCWEGRYSSAGVIQNTTTVFDGTSD